MRVYVIYNNKDGAYETVYDKGEAEMLVELYSIDEPDKNWFMNEEWKEVY